MIRISMLVAMIALMPLAAAAGGRDHGRQGHRSFLLPPITGSAVGFPTDRLSAEPARRRPPVQRDRRARPRGGSGPLFERGLVADPMLGVGDSFAPAKPRRPRTSAAAPFIWPPTADAGLASDAAIGAAADAAVGIVRFDQTGKVTRRGAGDTGGDRGAGVPRHGRVLTRP